jgi:hypothetical protein
LNRSCPGALTATRIDIRPAGPHPAAVAASRTPSAGR